MIQVNWKAAATVVTGATALAGWLTTPSPAPLRPRAAAAQVRVSSARDASAVHAATIEEQSLRLAARLRPDGGFAQPRRDPFHFGAPPPGPARTSASRAGGAAVAAAVAPAAAQPPPFPYRLSGMASDTVDGLPMRTAVLSGDDGLVLAVAGDVVGDVYRVERIDETAVELIDTRDGHATRLTFSAP